MTAPSKPRRWTKGLRVQCTCTTADPQLGHVVSAPRGPGTPYVQLDAAAEPHLCETAVIDPQYVAGPGRNPVRTVAVELAALSHGARGWYLELPRDSRTGAVVAALEVAARRAAELDAERAADHDARWCDTCQASYGAFDGCQCDA